MQDLHTLKHQISVSMGEKKAQVVLKNLSYVNVFTHEILQGDIAIEGEQIIGIGTYTGETEYNMEGKIALPGLMDAHIHLESSLVTPIEFAQAVLPHGTTCVVADPHEIANVCGTKGIDYMMESTKNLPLQVYYMMPSCVPAVPFEQNGATLLAEDISPYYQKDNVLGLGEMMHYEGVVHGETQVLEKIVDCKNKAKIIDGHAPSLKGNTLNAYILSGIYSDHECVNIDEAMEKMRKGQHVMIREGTAAKNLEALAPLIDYPYIDRLMFASDDKHPKDLMRYGHMDGFIKKAVALGADPVLCVKAASYNTAKYFGLKHKGALAPSYDADIVIVDNLQDFHVHNVFVKGKMCFDGKNVNMPHTQVSEQLKAQVTHSFHMQHVTEEDFFTENLRPLIGIVKGQIMTENLGTEKEIDVQKDVLKIAVFERHKNTGAHAVCFVKGYGLKRGAIATSVAHDSHNIIVIGADEKSMAKAVNHMIDTEGGMCIAHQDEVLCALSLPVAGLMSEEKMDVVAQKISDLKACAHTQGVSKGIDPFMTMSFLSLPVIPQIRIVSCGVFDVDNFTFIQ